MDVLLLYISSVDKRRTIIMQSITVEFNLYRRFYLSAIARWIDEIAFKIIYILLFTIRGIIYLYAWYDDRIHRSKRIIKPK